MVFGAWGTGTTPGRAQRPVERSRDTTLGIATGFHPFIETAIPGATPPISAANVISVPR
ncbi:hypothetical protein Acsp05_43600 [Actinokineospora sp. NBRC 105648]|nr:hypothetical protein Acsp05_43600 [Actinokineospora sp. NBRC 105648]